MASYFLLYQANGRVVASDATDLVGERLPLGLSADGQEYRALPEDTFMFWDDLHDASGRTVGYSFYMPSSKTFTEANLWWTSSNVTVEHSEARVLLGDCDKVREECVQGFESELYQNRADPADCMLIMYNFSQNPIAFDLLAGPGGNPVTRSAV